MSKNIDEVAVIVQARMGSRRVPRKMLKSFANTTLTDIILEKIKKCKSFNIDNFYFAAHEKELIDVGKKHDVNVFIRSRKSAMSEGTPMSEMYEWCKKLPHKYCVLINGCAPFLTIKTIDNFISEYINSDSEGMFGVIAKKNYFWNNNSKLISKWPSNQDVMNTKIVDITYEAAHCLYAGRMDLIKKGIWMGDFRVPGDIELFPMEEKECLDIDHHWQFEMCENLYKAIGN